MSDNKKTMELVLLSYGKAGASRFTSSDKAKRISRIVQACRFASDEDIKIIERVLRI